MDEVSEVGVIDNVLCDHREPCRTKAERQHRRWQFDEEADEVTVIERTLQLKVREPLHVCKRPEQVQRFFEDLHVGLTPGCLGQVRCGHVEELQRRGGDSSVAIPRIADVEVDQLATERLQERDERLVRVGVEAKRRKIVEAGGRGGHTLQRLEVFRVRRHFQSSKCCRTRSVSR